MEQPSARQVALAALKTWRNKKEFADRIISRLLSDSPLRSNDRAFALELFYGVLRNLTLLDFWINEVRPRRLDVDLRDVVRLGIYQLLIAKTAEHAAVYETVALVPKRQRAIVNGILRSAARERTRLETAIQSAAPEIRFSHPRFLLERWQRQFGAEAAEALCDWNNHPPPVYGRMNHLKIDRPTFLERYPEARALLTAPSFVELPWSSSALSQGDCYAQDPSTTIACELLAPQPGDKILDACAAPGGKTCYLAELLQNDGQIIACDRDPDRLSVLDENLVRLGVRIAQTVRHDWTNRQSPEEIRAATPFDRILIDAPCSNTGVMRRRVDVRWRLKDSDFPRMQSRQLQIIQAVLPLLKIGGTLVYGTCSLESEENEQVVQRLLKQNRSLVLEDERKSLPFKDHFDGAYAAKLRQKG